MNTRPDSAASDKGPLLLLSSRFSDWLASVDACLSLTTYQAGRLFFIGRKADGGVRAHERLIEQCQGLWTDGQTLWTSGRYMLWRFENVLRNGEITPTGADRSSYPSKAASLAASTRTTSGSEMSTARGDRSSSIRCIVAWRQ
jgi:hypothetical protein